MYYNKDVFAAEDVQSLDTMLTKGKVALPLTESRYAGCFFLGCGGTVFGEDGTDASAGIQFGEANGGYIAARKMVELASNPNMLPSGGGVYGLSRGEVDASFSGAWDYAEAKEALGDKLGVAMLPTFTAEGKEYQMKALSGSYCVGVNPNSDAVEGKPLVCTEFAAYLASQEAQLERYFVRGVIPAAQDLARHIEIMVDPVAVAQSQTLKDASVPLPSLPGMEHYWIPVGTFADQISNGEINETNYEEYVDEMMRYLNP